MENNRPLNIRVRGAIRSAKAFLKDGVPLSVKAVDNISINLEEKKDAFIYNDTYFSNKFTGQAELTIENDGQLLPSCYYAIEGYFKKEEDGKVCLGSPVMVGGKQYTNIG